MLNYRFIALRLEIGLRILFMIKKKLLRIFPVIGLHA